MDLDNGSITKSQNLLNDFTLMRVKRILACWQVLWWNKSFSFFLSQLVWVYWTWPETKKDQLSVVSNMKMRCIMQNIFAQTSKVFCHDCGKKKKNLYCTLRYLRIFFFFFFSVSAWSALEIFHDMTQNMDSAHKIWCI